MYPYANFYKNSTVKSCVSAVTLINLNSAHNCLTISHMVSCVPYIKPFLVLP